MLSPTARPSHPGDGRYASTRRITCRRLGSKTACISGSSCSAGGRPKRRLKALKKGSVGRWAMNGWRVSGSWRLGSCMCGGRIDDAMRTDGICHPAASPSSARRRSRLTSSSYASHAPTSCATIIDGRSRRGGCSDELVGEGGAHLDEPAGAEALRREARQQVVHVHAHQLRLLGQLVAPLGVDRRRQSEREAEDPHLARLAPVDATDGGAHRPAELLGADHLHAQLRRVPLRVPRPLGRLRVDQREVAAARPRVLPDDGPEEGAAVFEVEEDGAAELALLEVVERRVRAVRPPDDDRALRIRPEELRHLRLLLLLVEQPVHRDVVADVADDAPLRVELLLEGGGPRLLRVVRDQYHANLVGVGIIRAARSIRPCLCFRHLRCCGSGGAAAARGTARHAIAAAAGVADTVFNSVGTRHGVAAAAAARGAPVCRTRPRSAPRDAGKGPPLSK